MGKPKFYRPKRKQDLVNHLAQEHPKDVVITIQPHRWTVEALAELHDGIHEKRLVRSDG
jgi:hypothetical protein